MNQLTFKQYRNIDLTIFAILLAISETVATLASNSWFAAQPVALSSTLLFICIVMMRWGEFAAIHALLGGVVFCIASKASAPQFIIYVVGNAFALLSIFLLKAFGKEKTRKSIPRLLLFTGLTYVLMQIGRWLISLFFGGGLGAVIAYLGTDIISLLFAVVAMLLMRNTDGMIEDQKIYLLRINSEENKTDPSGYQYEE